MKTSVSSQLLPLRAAPLPVSVFCSPGDYETSQHEPSQDVPAWRHQAPVTEDALLDRIAQSVEILRAHRGWSLAELGRRAGLTTSQAKHMARRRGNPGLADILGIANAFGVTIGQLAGNRMLAVETLNPDPAQYDLETLHRTAGTRLRAHRQRQRMSIKTLAKRSTLSTTTIRSLERTIHTPTLRTIIRIAAGFNLSLAELVDVLRVPRVRPAPRSAPGVILRTFLHESGEDEDVHLHEVHLRSGQTYVWPLMERGSSAMTYVLEGTVLATSDGTAFPAAAGEAAVIAMDRPFSLTVESTATARCLLVVRTATKSRLPDA
jgi:transcriptional regulator with XRE-family HTH domain